LGTLEGLETIFYKDGGKYIGQVDSAGVEHGSGVSYWADGNRRYQGELKGGKRDGEGTSYYPDGTRLYNGFWGSGEYDGFGVEYYASGDKWLVGGWKAGRFYGDGTKYDKEQEVIVSGKWRNNRLVDVEVSKAQLKLGFEKKYYRYKDSHGIYVGQIARNGQETWREGLGIMYSEYGGISSGGRYFFSPKNKLGMKARGIWITEKDGGSSMTR
jgi:antitoxin component YwqK of YwqJK toxin-antitoxin module